MRKLRVFCIDIEFGKLRSYLLTNLMLVTKSLALPNPSMAGVPHKEFIIINNTLLLLRLSALVEGVAQQI